MSIVELKAQVKQVLVEELMLDVTPDQIQDTDPLFGPNSLGLDSVDALQLVVALEKRFGLKLKNEDVARPVLQNVETIAKAVEANNQG